MHTRAARTCHRCTQIPEDQQDQFTTLLTAYCDKRERQAFDVGFKAAAQLCQQLNNTEEIYGGLTK
mgnify:CR=1 FL=1